ncbi:unnamed protein product [Polarella glacialis]|uniref:Uncharacterized protein n=1 Tax=Polarella glacialis TaxID=89957 RepID=A0A813LIZ5_POLGL|nr:unnamed protein product [Polarella glacialis]CAE8702476.1 unnamed protein product [Polarella glacialis]CAE8730009.1 unnamed protein product [Polarella glacialis]|mmetsp:Transcript_54299/g.87715  ORF Transcript_54299/g.87715 Transcript_54299/m.87715 type:complete len:182 (-) Transcript_54299:559-1104(-)|eukprot:CAMPEP_0115088692 /NCGR_PEP_ID=MMETSP0227-20121206/24165_1 /TAXON_ID=89957 /ORGANISM="Polarella glacialis, Strain CCMP 1383" /LENGTH=181 /DNA_ID=CAMNT_0002479055 /DNA_START=34 /DNA_END=579 /DNA_ORIENTATION=+
MTTQRKRSRQTAHDSNTIIRDIGRLALSTAAQMRTVRAAALRTFIVPATSAIATAVRKAGADFSASVQARNGAQSLPPPHILAVQAILSAMRDDPKIPGDIKSVTNTFLARGLTANELGRVVRVCRSSKCFQRDLVRIELHLPVRFPSFVMLLLLHVWQLAGESVLEMPQEAPWRGQFPSP